VAIGAPNSSVLGIYAPRTHFCTADAYFCCPSQCVASTRLTNRKNGSRRKVLRRDTVRLVPFSLTKSICLGMAFRRRVRYSSTAFSNFIFFFLENKAVASWPSLVLTSLFPSSSPFPMTVGASRSRRVLHRVSGRSPPRLGFLSSLWLDNLGARALVVWLAATWVSRVALSRLAPFGALSVSRPLGLGALVKLRRVSPICRRGVCVGFIYLEGSEGGRYGEKRVA